MGMRLGFIATRSGLTRFGDHSHLFQDVEEDTKGRKKKKKKKKKTEEKKEADEDFVPEP